MDRQPPERPTSLPEAAEPQTARGATGPGDLPAHSRRTRECFHAIRECAKPVVVTLGEHGCLVHDGWEMRLIPALDVVAVNTLGAGDVYRAAFGYGRMQGWGIEECARYGNAAAALQCTVLGNAADVPAKHEVDGLMRRAVYRAANRDGLETAFAQLRREYMPLVMK